MNCSAHRLVQARDHVSGVPRGTHMAGQTGL
jgi:hypothetical protein